MSTIPNVQRMNEDADRVFTAAYQIVESMATGSRKQIKDLAADVSAATGMNPKRVLGFMNYFVHEVDIAYVTRGKNGGLIKGVRPVKVAKVKKAKKVADTAPATDSNQ